MADIFDEAQAEELEAEFQQVLTSLSGDKSLERFHAEYEKVYTALRRSHETEKKLVKKVKDLNNEIVVNAAKVSSALKLSEEDSNTIDELKKQVERAWSMVEAANAREEAANSSIERLQDDVNMLTASLQKHQQLLGADTSIEDVINSRDTFQAKLREAEHAVVHERDRADELVKELTIKTDKYKEKKAQIKELERQLASKAAEEARDAKKRANLESEVTHMREQIAQRTKAAEGLKKVIEEAEEKNANLEKQLQSQRYAMTTSLNDFHKLHKDMAKLATDLEEQVRQVSLLKEEKQKSEREIRLKMEEISRGKAAEARLQAKLDSEAREKERIQRTLDEEKIDGERMRTQLAAMEKTLDQENLRAKATERTIAKLDREKSTMEKKVVTEAGKAAVARADMESKGEELTTLENENRRLMMEATKMRTVISVLERDRERIRQQMEEMEKQWKDAQEGVRSREAAIADLEKKDVEMANKLKQSQTAYESLRTEKAALAKELLQAQDDIAEMKRKNKVQANQIEQLKDDIHAKDRALVAEEFEHQSVEKRLEQRTHEVEQLKRLLDEANLNITKQDNEIVDLNNTIRRLDSEALAQKRAYDQVVTERDILGTQLIRRNDELALLYEKLSIQASTLSKGEAQYKERMEDIRLLKIKIADLRRELTLATASAGATTDLKREVARLQREMLQEQTKVKALSEELENPMNVHRWRKLEGSDPATYEMIQKIQTLQRRLIAKTEEVVERDMLLVEKEKMYNELKAMLARQPGPEVAEALAHYQHLVSERTKQLKALASELQMYQTQISDNKYEIDKLNRQLFEAKKAYFDLKGKDRAAPRVGAAILPGEAPLTPAGDAPKDFATRAAESQKAAAMGSTARFVGGGFNVNAA